MPPSRGRGQCQRVRSLRKPGHRRERGHRTSHHDETHYMSMWFVAVLFNNTQEFF